MTEVVTLFRQWQCLRATPGVDEELAAVDDKLRQVLALRPWDWPTFLTDDDPIVPTEAGRDARQRYQRLDRMAQQS
jgi:hypothetical protein